MKAALTLFLTLLSFLSFSQQYDLSGHVVDSLGNGIAYASVALAQPADSSTVQFVIAKEDGQFALQQIESGKYLLVVGSYGYNVSYQEIYLDSNITDWKTSLHAEAISLEQVMFRAPSIPILVTGDTVIYNANSFKTQSNATVEDLIKKLPGITINKDGTINTEGESVTKVLINGKEFFGGNIEAATKNLDASLVDKVEVIDRKTDEDAFTGEDDNEREKVINLVLKEEQTQGYFGTLRGGYGPQDFYDVKGNVNFFNEKTQLSIIGGFNNIDRRLYGWQEMSTLQSFEVSPFNNWNRGITWWNSGITTRQGVGANLHIQPTKGFRADVSYIYSDESSIKSAQTNSEIYLDSSTLFFQSNETSEGTNGAHQLNAKIEMEDSVNRVVIRAKYSTQGSAGLNMTRSFNYLELPAYLNSGVNRDDLESGDSKYAVKVHWTLKSKKDPRDHLLTSVYYGASQLSNQFLSYFDARNGELLPLPGQEEPLVDQQLQTKENTIATTTAYQFQLTDKFYIRPGFNWMMSEYNHQYDWIQDDGQLVKNLSPIGTAKAQNLEYYVHLSYKLDSFTTLHIVPEFNQSIEDRDFLTDSQYQYGFNQTFFIPYMFMRGSKPHKYNWRFHVRANVNKPNINQLLPIVDNSNPYNTTVGNIELQNNIRYSNSWHYRRMFGLGKSLSFWGWNSYNLNGVVNQTSITNENFRITESINFKYRLNSNHGVNLDWPLKFMKAQLGLGLNYDYARSYFIRNEEELEVLNHGRSISTSLGFNEFDLWAIDLGYEVGLNNGSIGGIENNGFLIHEIYTELLLLPTPRIEIGLELDWEIYGSNSVVGATSIPILSAEVSWYLDKGQRWAIGARAFDLLDKNQNIWRYWAANSFSQYQNNSIQRYVLATLAYKIKKPSKDKQ